MTPADRPEAGGVEERLLDFIEDGCTARAADKHHAKQAVEALVAALREAEGRAEARKVALVKIVEHCVTVDQMERTAAEALDATKENRCEERKP